MDGKPTNLRPFRMLISLLDKPEIGAAILEDVLIDVFRYMYKQCEAINLDVYGKDNSCRFSAMPSLSRNGRKTKQRKQEKTMNTEIIKTANLLFGSFEPYFMWDFLGRTFEMTITHMVPSKKGSVKRSKGRQPAMDMDSPINIVELCILIEFLLDKAALVGACL